jgi:hypothetical protein
MKAALTIALDVGNILKTHRNANERVRDACIALLIVR